MGYSENFAIIVKICHSENSAMFAKFSLCVIAKILFFIF